MTLQPLEFDGPRMVRREELPASDRLSQICFGGLDVNALKKNRLLLFTHLAAGDFM